MASLLFIQTVVVHKFAFLLFYFIPVLLVGFYKSARQAVLTALLTIALVAYVAIINPFSTSGAAFGAGIGWWNLLIWSCFLILTGAIVGRLHEKNRLQAIQLREAYLGIIHILTKYLEAADTYTRNHSDRVASLSVLLARQLDLPPHEVENVWAAGLLHDIGKAEVLDLVRKAGGLTPQEKAEVDRHASLGAEILHTTGSVLRDAVPLVREHHRAYSDGGRSIPLGARIISVADAYDALVSDRPYRAGRPHWEAVEVLEEAAGDQFDPKIVETLKNAEQPRVGVVRAGNEWTSRARRKPGGCTFTLAVKFSCNAVARVRPRGSVFPPSKLRGSRK